MRQRKALFDRVLVERSTETAKTWLRDVIEKAENAKHDVDKQKRLENDLCKTCFYIHSKIGGAAMTHRECGICSEDQLYSSTATDIICTPCSKENGLCKRCGADLEFKSRRKPYPFMEK